MGGSAMVDVMTASKGTPASTMGGKTLVRHGASIPRDKRRELFGIDIPDLLEWRNWQPGTEYSKNLVCKNVTTSTIKIKYKQTASKAFSMGFPEPIKLRPGMSCPLQVIFRPLKQQQYSDHIEIFVNDMASFIVLVEAYTPATHVQVPASLSFGFVPCKELQQQPLTVTNSGDIKVNLSWKLDPPFSIEPESCSLAAGATHTFTVSFLPQEAGSFTGNAACSVEGGTTSVTRIGGVAKFPYLSLEQGAVDFGSVVVGRTLERTIRFGNHSMVNANFTLAHDDPAKADGVFTISPSSGTLGPEEFSVIKVVYTPKHTGTFSCEGLTLATPGGNRLALVLKGTAAAPKVTFSARVLNYGNMVCDTSSSRVLYLQNHSDVPVLYDFQVDHLDCFTINKPQGTINPGLTGHVTISFKSSAPANFWRRVSCLIKDADPIGIDLLATSYTDKSRPPPLEHRHVLSYLARVAAGGEAVDNDPATAGSVPASPVPSQGQYDSRPVSPDAPPGSEQGQAMNLNSSLNGAAAQVWAGPDAWQLLYNGQDPANALTVDTDVLQFGSCSRLTASEYQSVTVTNNTRAKVMAFFNVPLWRDPGGGELKQVFHVLPESADIKAGGQATFRVAFRPSRDAAHVCQVLTLCGYVKSMRNFRLVTDSQVVPPWSIPVTASGNTFLHTNPEFSPKISISHTKISFPPCRPSEQVCQTLCLSNYGDTPASFAFTNMAALRPMFSIKPSTGVVQPKGHVLVALRFQPTNTSPVEAKAILTLNGVALAATEITLRGTGHTPQLVVDVSNTGGAAGGAAASAGGALFFRPTCVGANAQRTVTLRNPSRVPVCWQWQLDGVIEVSPVSGLLRGSEAVPITWTFTPAKQKVYEASAKCYLLHPDSLTMPSFLLSPLGEGPDAEGQGVTSLKVVGEGTASALAIEPAVIDMGDVKVGHPVKQTIRLLNQSDGMLRYTLDCLVGPTLDDTQDDLGERVEFLGNALVAEAPREEELWVDEVEGTIPARATKDVTITLFPRHRKHYSLQLLCRSATLAPPAPAATARPPSGSSGPGAVRLPPLLASARQLSPDPHAPHIEVAAVGALKAPLVLDPASSVSLVCPVLARATFPALMVTDVLCDGVSKQVMWSQLCLPEVNTELAAGVTLLELELEKMENKGSLTTDRACAALRPFRLDFGCLPHEGSPATLYVQLTNPTPLPVHWELHSYDDPDLEVENWVEPGRPRNEKERARDFITEHKIFELRPRAGHLAGGESGLLMLQYRPGHVGSHEFPMFLRVANGKRLHLQLAGRTVDPPVQRLSIAPRHRTLTLPPTPIGTQAPPVQLYLLRNGGPGTCAFEVDTAPLTALRNAHYGHEIIRLTGSASGTVPEGGAAALTWQFSPLESKVYSINVPVQLGDGSIELLTLVGRGYHPTAPDQPPPLIGEGDRDVAKWAGFSQQPCPQLAVHRLVLPSQDGLELGTTLPGGLVRRVTLLTNTSPYPVMYSWDLGPLGQEQALAGGKLDITPHSGRLQPGERVVARLTFTAPLVPYLLEGEVSCEVVVDEEAVMEAVGAARDAADAATAAARVELTETGSVVEEVVARHPEVKLTPPYGRHRTRHTLAGRLPVHLAMTSSLLGQMGGLGGQWNKTLTQYRKGGEGEGYDLDLPPPQKISLALTGRVLTRDHINLGLFIPPSQLEEAREALERTAWVPPTTAPFYTDKELLHRAAAALTGASAANHQRGSADGTASDLAAQLELLSNRLQRLLQQQDEIDQLHREAAEAARAETRHALARAATMQPGFSEQGRDSNGGAGAGADATVQFEAVRERLHELLVEQQHMADGEFLVELDSIKQHARGVISRTASIAGGALAAGDLIQQLEALNGNLMEVLTAQEEVEAAYAAGSEERRGEARALLARANTHVGGGRRDGQAEEEEEGGALAGVLNELAASLMQVMEQREQEEAQHLAAAANYRNHARQALSRCTTLMPAADRPAASGTSGGGTSGSGSDSPAGAAGDDSDKQQMDALSLQLNSLLGGAAAVARQRDESGDGAGDAGGTGADRAETGGLKSRRPSPRVSDAQEFEEEENSQEASVGEMDITFAQGVAGPEGRAAAGAPLARVKEEAEEEAGGRPTGEGSAADVQALLAAAAGAVGEALSASEVWPPAGGRAPGTEAGTPLPQVPAPKIPGPPEPTPLQAAQQAAGQLLQQLLQQVLDPQLDADVAAALQCLPKQQLPAYVQLQSPGVPDLVLHGGAAATAVITDHATAPVTDDGVMEEEEAGTQQEAGASATVPLDIKSVLRDPRFQELAEYVLSSTVLGLIEESAADEWEAPA